MVSEERYTVSSNIVLGHKSHINIELANFCSKNKIMIYCLLPNATHILKSCDVSIFKPLKEAWKKDILKY